MSTKVQEDARRIDALIEQNAAAGRDTGDSGADDSAGASPDSDAGVDTQQGAEVVDFDRGEQGEPETDTSAIPAEIQQELENARKARELAEQRWKSLDGQLRSRDEQIERLTQLLGNMQTAQAQPAEQSPEAAVGVKQSDADDFGEDMIDFVRRLARSIAREEINSVTQTLEGLSREVKNVSQHTAVAVNDSFESKLDSLAPEWRKLDTDQAFHDWLNASPTKKDMFLQAVQQKDAPLVAEFFTLFSGSVNAGKQQKTENRREQLEKQVAPGKGRSTKSPDAQPSKDERIWTRSEIAKVYADYSAGNIPKDEWAALEKEIASAQKHDRVDYSR